MWIDEKCSSVGVDFQKVWSRYSRLLEIFVSLVLNARKSGPDCMDLESVVPIVETANNSSIVDLHCYKVWF